MYRLCLALGYPSPDHLLACLTSSQLAGWMAYSSIDPFGEYRAELRHGQQMALQANINRDSKRKPDPYTAAEFMNFFEQEKPADNQDVETKLATIFGG